MSTEGRTDGRVLLLRHAESANPNVFHGFESDVDLSERGRRQAEALAEVLAARSPQVLVSSGMRRALQTAAPIGRVCGLPIQVEADLHERRVGALSGVAVQTDGVWRDTLRRWRAGDTGYAPEGAESFDAIRARVLPVWERVARQHEGKTLVVVAHGIVCRVLLLSLLPGWGLADWKRLSPMRNAALHEVVRGTAGWEAVRLNDLPDSVAAC
jgi:broad specificity phosphatase PhoE